jgi:hypothetical protein
MIEDLMLVTIVDFEQVDQLMFVQYLMAVVECQ